MRFLKNKVSKALQRLQGTKTLRQQEVKQSYNEPSPVSTSRVTRSSPANSQTKSALASPSTKHTKTSKNLVKNYGRAMAAFALLPISKKHLDKLLKEKNLTPEEFKDFMEKHKDSINGISTLRSLILVERNDSEKLILCKKVFQEISIIFIKFYSVNWIFDSKIGNKIEHLKCRCKMLRRIRVPEHFTYLKT